MDPRFTLPELNLEGRTLLNEVQERLSDILRLVEVADPSRDRACGVTHLEEAEMWFAKAIARTAGMHVV